MSRSLSSLAFTQPFAALPAPFYARIRPEPLPSPYLVSYNPDAASLIGLDPTPPPDLAAQIAGLTPVADPLATRYSGHQFGIFVPNLGDGRALLLGQVGDQEIQVKGSGRTPFSRAGDGRAVLRSTIREYLASEAMHGLGIATTRALAIVGSDQPVQRETVETAAVLVRLAPSHIRFGSFELFAHQARPDLVQELADFVIARHFPGHDYLTFLQEVAERTARTVAAWQAVGFTHGVLNTDNMSILGLTLDYGPYAFVEAYEPLFTPNHTDVGSRYALTRQPAVAAWNLGCLTHALRTLVPDSRPVLAAYAAAYTTAAEGHFQAKLGLPDWRGDDDDDLVRGLLALLARQRVDYPRFFRLLATQDPGLRDLFVEPTACDAFMHRYAARNPAPDRARMLAANPKYVLRTHLAQRAIARAEAKDYSEIDRLLHILRRPFDEQPEHEAYALPAPDAHVHALSCSS